MKYFLGLVIWGCLWALMFSASLAALVFAGLT